LGVFSMGLPILKTTDVRAEAGASRDLGLSERMTMDNSALAYSVSEACSIACAGRSSVYEAIRSGALRAVKRGRRTLILADDLRSWVESLPSVTVKPVKQSSNDGGSND
jgi:excisionase family DNA binding protein